MKNSPAILSLVVTCAISFNACSTSSPMTVGGIGGGLAGGGVGAVIANSTGSTSLMHGAAIGGALGIPAGMLIAYVSNYSAEHYVTTVNAVSIDSNNDEILENQQIINEARGQVLSESPIGSPDEDLEDTIYVGQSLGNPWR